MSSADTYLSVYVVHYRAKDDPYHWSIFVEKNAEALDGAIFDIQGTPDNYTFRSKGKASMKRSNTYAGRVCVGSTLGTDKNLGKVEIALKEVKIVFHDKHWNCQNWVLEGLKLLEKKELLLLNIAPANVKHYLSEEEIREALKSATS